MTLTIQIASRSFTPEALQSIFRADADYRRDERVQPGQEVIELRHALEKFTENFLGVLGHKIDTRQSITGTDIENARTLEKLMLEATYDYKHAHFSKLRRSFEDGVVGGRKAGWKMIELQAGQAGLLAGHTGEVRVKATHRFAEIGSHLQ